MLAVYCYAVRHGLKVQHVTPYRVSLLQRYGVTVRGNVTSVYLSLVRGYIGDTTQQSGPTSDEEADISHITVYVNGLKQIRMECYLTTAA